MGYSRIMIKKFALLLVFALVIALIGCAGTQSTTTETTTETTSGTTISAYPEPVYVDKSNLEYVSSLDSYKKTDWSGYWIWGAINAPDIYVAFRKTFSIDELPDKVMASISAESKYFMWVNGILTIYDGNVKRGPTEYDSYYDEVEMKNLQVGENTIAFLVVYNGRSSDSALDAGMAGFLFETEINGNVIASDSSFKTMRLREYKNKSLLKGDYPNYPQSSMLGEWNVYYDARDSVGNFMDPEYDDSEWPNAIGIAKAGSEPFNDLYLCPTPTIAFGDIVDFENSDDYLDRVFTEDTTIELNLPLNRQFSTYFELEAPAGKKLIMYTDTYSVGVNEKNFKDTYISSEGVQSYENYPWRTGSKLFIEVPAGVKFTRLGYRPSGYDTSVSGSFTSDNIALNSLWEKAVNTLLINMRDTFMDCPDRERAPYMGDSSVQMDMVYYSLDSNAYEMIKKAILVEIGWTENTFLIPSRAPSRTPHEIPVQSLAFIVSAYNYYLYTGDEETIRLFYPVAINYLKVWNLQDNGLLEIRSGTWTWTDWGTGIDNEVIQNCWYYYALVTTEKLANSLGISTDLDFINARKTSIKDNFKPVFQQSDGGFRSGDANDDRANALAVLSGLADPEDYTAITGILLTVKQASPFYEKYVLQALCEMGEYQYAIARMLDRYGPMIEDSGTTLWELWSLSAAASVSVNHGWSGGPLVIMSKYLAGISPTSPGYETYEITPQKVFADLSTSVETVKGTIDLSIHRNPDNSYTIIINTIDASGVLNIPVAFGTNIVFNSGSYQSIQNKDGCNSFSISGGSYNITVN